MISIVMTTYNGERYIKQQLESILRQSVPPDEVLIFDDGSKDETINIVKEFISTNDLTSWKLTRNESNKGWQRNFIDGISFCTGDYVFLADQDDIWHSKKLEVMSTIIENQPEILLLVCGTRKFFDTPPVESEVRGKWKHLEARRNNVNTPYPGCSYCFRKSFFDKIRFTWVDRFPHDAFIFQAAWMTNSIYICDDELHFFRRHSESVTTLSKTDFSRNGRMQRIERRLVAAKAIKENLHGYMMNQYVDEYVKWLRLRYDLLREKVVINWIKLIPLMRFYTSIKTWAVDFIVLFR